MSLHVTVLAYPPAARSLIVNDAFCSFLLSSTLVLSVVRPAAGVEVLAVRQDGQPRHRVVLPDHTRDGRHSARDGGPAG